MGSAPVSGVGFGLSPKPTFANLEHSNKDWRDSVRPDMPCSCVCFPLNADWAAQPLSKVEMRDFIGPSHASMPGLAAFRTGPVGGNQIPAGKSIREMVKPVAPTPPLASVRKRRLKRKRND
jgi:hypothetical protein